VAVFVEAGDGAVAYALSRLFDTGLGLGIALLVNYFLMPPTYDRQALKEIRKAAPEIIKTQNRMLGVLMHRQSISLDDLQSEIDHIEEGQAEIRKFVELQEKEEKLRVHGEMSMKEVMLVFKLISESLFDTGLGLGIALVVNYFLMPPTYDRQALKEIQKAAPQIIKTQNRMLGVLMHRQSISLYDLQSEIDHIEEGQAEIKKFVELQEKEEKLRVHGEMSMKEVMLVFKLISEMNQHLQNLMGIVEKGVSRSIMQPMEKELIAIYEELVEVEKELENSDEKLSDRLEEIEDHVNKAKKKIKNQETAVPLSVEETIKFLVVLYNVEEILSKSSIIFSYSMEKNH